MDYLYFPGCTLYTKAKNFDQTARDCSRLLGFELKELKNWTCCGATFPLATDNIMALLPPSRILATAREEGTALTTLCAVCFNVIKKKTGRRGIRSTILLRRTIRETFKSSTIWRF
jgi:heterodisulfide reductase subunit B